MSAIRRKRTLESLIRPCLGNVSYYLDTAEQRWSSDDLRQAAMRTGNVLTFSCLPPGSGSRIALDTNAD
ncbi:hypothetical protein [Marinobacter alexandrii]|uniref:hypothetical protein n=1 Tax=Marinobacter alexandrii TaxID=2570351 RepID=UPI0032996286